MKFKLQTCFIGLTVATFLVTIGIIYFGYINKTTDRLYFSITQFDLPNSNDFTIGENSDICYKDIPEKYMTVSYDNGAFSYKINNSDSCLYYFINDTNYNKVTIHINDNIQVFGQVFSGKYLINKLKKLDNEYYMLKDVMIDDLSTKIRNSINTGEIEFNSFIQKKHNKYYLIILDKFTKINNIGYCYSKTLSPGQEFKIQFFKMNSWSVKKQEKRFWDYVQFWDYKTYLSDSIRSYFAKPVQIFTEWGAGHILVKRNDLHYSATFPKAISTTIPIKRIIETADSSETGVYLKQMLKSYYMPTDFYIPAFSNALSENICELSVAENFNLVFQKANNRDTANCLTSGSLIPKINIKNQQLVTGGITYKTRVLNTAFYWSKHWSLAIAWFILMLILHFSFPKSGDEPYAEKVKDIRSYICGMFTLFWFFLNQKLLIAEKLTFTYPYFEKIYSVVYITTLFSLFAVFLLIVLINRSYFDENALGEDRYSNNPFRVKKSGWFNWIIACGITSICIYAYCKIKSNFILPIWNSYIDKDSLDIWTFWKWQKIGMLNDNHFTVFMIIGSLLIFLLVLFIILFCIKRKWFKRIEKVKKITRWTEQIYDIIYSRVSNLINFKKPKTYAIYLIIIIIALFFVVALLGNSGTAVAIIMLLLLLGKTMKVLIDDFNQIEDFNKWAKWIFLTMLGVCIFVGIGMYDFGFFINVFGIAVTWIFLIILSAKYFDNYADENETIIKKQIKKGLGLGFLLVIVSCFIIFWWNSNPEKIDYERNTRRIQNCIYPNQVKEAGYLYTESDMQWMEVMRHYAEKASKSTDDIYSEDNNFHQLIASGQSPVVLNDVSIPTVYLGSLRWLGLFGLFYGIMALGFFVYSFSIGDVKRINSRGNNIYPINLQLIRRLLAGNLWIFVTLYLIKSYYWDKLPVPFTGRLIPGFGVDAVGEALEIIVLFAFMCSLYNPYKQNIK